MREDLSAADCDLAIIQSFFRPERIERSIQMLATQNKRRKLLMRLHDAADLNPKCMTRLAPQLQTEDAIVSALYSSARPSAMAYLMSEHSLLDARFVSISDAVSQIFARGLATIIFVPETGRGYFEGEGLRERYWLHGPPAMA